MRQVSGLRARILLLTGILVLLVIATLGPGLLTRHGQRLDCSAGAIGCPESGSKSPFDYQADDGRVAGNPGDLMVLYCQRQYRNISVYGIDHGAGTFLASFEVDKLRGAGALSEDLGAKGVVSMAWMPSSGAYYVVLKGGLVEAAGLDTVAKLFHCDF